MQTTLFSRIQIILADAFAFFVQHITQIAALCLPFIFVTTVFDFMLGVMYRSSPLGIAAPLLINLMVYPIYTAALIQLMSRRARQEHPKNAELVVAAMQQWAPLFALKIIMVLLIGLGISLFILPGIWMGVRLVFAEFYLVLFGMSPRDAIVKSFGDTRHHFVLILILLMATYVPILALGLATDQMMQALTANYFFRIVASAGWSLIGLLVHVVLFRAYMQILSEKNERAELVQ